LTRFRGHFIVWEEGVHHVQVSAVADILAYWANHNLRACIPPDSVANGQLTAVVRESLREHPEATNESASALIVAALSSAFTCNQ